MSAEVGQCRRELGCEGPTFQAVHTGGTAELLIVADTYRRRWP